MIDQDWDDVWVRVIVYDPILAHVGLPGRLAVWVEICEVVDGVLWLLVQEQAVDFKVENK